MGPPGSYCNGTTSALQQEYITSKGMCVLSIKMPIGKKGVETYRMHLVYA